MVGQTEFCHIRWAFFPLLALYVAYSQDSCNAASSHGTTRFLLRRMRRSAIGCGVKPMVRVGVFCVQVLYNKLCFLPLGKGLKSRQLRP